MKKITRLRVSPIGDAVLGMVATVGVVSVLAVFPGVAVLVAPFLKNKKYSHKQAIKRNIESLIKSGLLEESIGRNGEMQLKLTPKGKKELQLRRAKFENTPPTTWDGVWRVVIFDVPEDKAKIRIELRRAMIAHGFRMLQKSVWVYPFPCDDFIALIKDYLGITHDVLYMKVSHIENDKHLRKEFKLS